MSKGHSPCVSLRYFLKKIKTWCDESDLFNTHSIEVRSIKNVVSTQQDHKSDLMTGVDYAFLRAMTL